MFDLGRNFSSSSALTIPDSDHTFREEVLSFPLPKIHLHCRLIDVRELLTNNIFLKGFTIVKITTPAGKIGKCIEFTTGSQVKYALKVVTTTNIIFEVSTYTEISVISFMEEKRLGRRT